MERPQVEPQIRHRDITAEIVYLDDLRRQNQEPRPFIEIGEAAMQLYQAQADSFIEGERPAIMAEYEQYDSRPSEVVASCIALADVLLALKKPGTSLTFVDIAVEASPATVLEKLQATSAGSLLAGDDKQLALPSDGEYYPVLDIRKRNATLVGVGLTVWGWDDKKYVFTNTEGEQFKYPEHALVYPSDEKSSTRQLELTLGYRDLAAGSFSESISLYLTADGSARISSRISAAAYAETGYEGHGGSSLDNLTDDDVAAFGDLVAELVGDEPQSVSMQITRQLQELTDALASPSARQAVQDLIAATWPAQAVYFLSRRLKGSDATLAQQLSDQTTAAAATSALHEIINAWKGKRN